MPYISQWFRHIRHVYVWHEYIWMFFEIINIHVPCLPPLSCRNRNRDLPRKVGMIITAFVVRLSQTAQLNLIQKFKPFIPIYTELYTAHRFHFVWSLTSPPHPPPRHRGEEAPISKRWNLIFLKPIELKKVHKHANWFLCILYTFASPHHLL